MEILRMWYDPTLKLQSWICPICQTISIISHHFAYHRSSLLDLGVFVRPHVGCGATVPGSPKSTGGVCPWRTMPQWIWEPLGAGSTAKSRNARAAQAGKSEQCSVVEECPFPDVPDVLFLHCCIHRPWNSGFDATMWRFRSVLRCPLAERCFFIWTMVINPPIMAHSG